MWQLSVGILAGAGSAFRILNGRSQLQGLVPERTAQRRAIGRAAVIVLPIFASIAALDLLDRRGYHTAAFMSILRTLVAIPMLFIFYRIARKNDRSASRLVANPWVSREYDSGEWRRFTGAQSNSQIQRLGKQAPQFFAGPNGILVGDKFVPWSESGVTLKEALRQAGAADFVSFRFEVNYGKGRVTLQLATHNGYGIGSRPAIHQRE